MYEYVWLESPYRNKFIESRGNHEKEFWLRQDQWNSKDCCCAIAGWGPGAAAPITIGVIIP